MLNFEKIQQMIGYRFQNIALCIAALTHSSVQNKVVVREFDRLEFLGDRVLNLLISFILYEKFPSESEGLLASRYSALVCFETCAEIAESIKLSECLEVANKSSLADSSILSDALEALLGAIFLDGGIQPCLDFVGKYWKNRIEQVPKGDSKSELQKLVLAEGMTLPIYTVVSKEGTEHEPFFIVSVEVNNWGKENGSGRSKKHAEKDAAKKMLKKILNKK